MKLLTCLLALLLFVNPEFALGNTITLFQMNVQLDIPDGFVFKDFPGSAYTGIKSGPKGNEIIDVSSSDAPDENTNVADPTFINTQIAKCISLGYQVFSYEARTIGDHQFLVADLRGRSVAGVPGGSGGVSAVVFFIVSEGHIITITYARVPSVETRMMKDPIPNNMMKSFEFIQTPVVKPPPNSHSMLGDLINLGIVVIVVGAGLYIYSAFLTRKNKKS